jgi:hypothetical protein
MSSESPTDVHGIKKIYKSATRSDAPTPFIMGSTNWRNRIDQWEGDFDGSGLDTVFTWDSDQMRMNVFADESRPTAPSNADQLNRDELRERSDNDGVKRGGWMTRSNDWRDYEVTAIEFFPDNDDADDTSSWYGRGAKHTGGSINAGSQGSAYKPDLLYAGNDQGWKVLKETIHYGDYKNGNSETIREQGDGNDNVQFNQNIGDLRGKWIGVKTVVFNWEDPVPYQGSRYWPVQIETYTCDCDTNGNPDNNWVRKFMCMDHPSEYGEWSSLPDDQEGANSTISWGGPIITCRTDERSGDSPGLSGMKFKKVSIREILPNQKL